MANVAMAAVVFVLSGIKVLYYLCIDTMDIVEILRKRDINEIKNALIEVHRQKAFSLADSEYLSDERKNAARYHAYHLALISQILPDVETDVESITGLDYRLAKAFREGIERCNEIPHVEEEFYKIVVNELNRIIRTLCIQNKEARS